MLENLSLTWPLSSHTEQIYVGIITTHLLAAHHLSELIKLNFDMVPFIMRDGVKSENALPHGAHLVILIDLWDIPVPDSEYLDAFVAEVPGCSFLAMDQPRKEMDVVLLLRAGFSGFISHDEAHLLGPAIHTVANGNVWAPPGVIRAYMNLTFPRAKVREIRTSTLTVRENQVLDLLRRRYSNKELAGFLGISESTAKFHVSNVLTKLNARCRRDLTDRECSFLQPIPRFSIKSAPESVSGATGQSEPSMKEVTNGHDLMSEVKIRKTGSRW